MYSGKVQTVVFISGFVFLVETQVFSKAIGKSYYKRQCYLRTYSILQIK